MPLGRFEIFDDVAFYFVAVIILAIFLVPTTLFWIARAAYRHFRPATVKHELEQGRYGYLQSRQHGC